MTTKRTYERDRLAFEAASQIQALAWMLRREQAKGDTFPEVLLSSCVRIDELSRLLCTRLGEDNQTTEEMAHTVGMEVSHDG